MFNGFCPTCGDQIPSERFLGASAVCRCGWMDNTVRAKAFQATQKRTIITFMVVSVAVLIGYGHLLTWGGHAFSIPFLEAARLTGTISPGGLESIIEACQNRGRLACVEETYVELYQKTRNPDALARLARLQFQLKRDQQALVNFELWARAGGSHDEAAYEYAQLLERTGQPDQAIAWYTKSIESNQDSRLPVRATTGLVRLLMNERRYEEAYERVIAFHESAGNADDYLAAELAELQGLVKESKRKMAAR